MARKRTNPAALTTRDFELADARHLLKGLRKHESVLEEAGVTEPDLEEFEAVIAEALAHNRVAEIAAQIALDQQRLDVRTRLGSYRRWSEVVAQPPKGRDATAAKTLKVDIAFPNDDAELVIFMKGLDSGMKKYSAALTKRSFGRDQQQGLLDSYATFVKLQKEVKAQKSVRTQVSGDRNSAFTMLRSYTKSYRKIGMTFFHGQAAEKDFQRLTKQRKPSAAAVAKAAEKKQAKKDAAAAKMAARTEKKSARKPAARDTGNGASKTSVAGAA